MGKKLIIAEKPSVARSIAKVVGCKTNGEGCIYNEYYCVTWALGHLVTLQEPNDIDEKYSTWKMDTLPIKIKDIPLKVISETAKQYKIVKDLINSKDIDSLVCATDAGREGELIFRHIYIKSGCRKPFERLWISSLTDESIREGMKNLQPGKNYDTLYQSAKARAEADWLVGMNATRAFTLRYEVLLSVGRVQTPTLSFLVERKKEIDQFIPKNFYVLNANFTDYTGVFFSDKLKPDTHIMDKTQAEKLANIIKGKTGTVVSIDKQIKKEQPPQLYDLTSLQRDANKKYGFTAERTLKLAQSLYENHKALTYPRTDSRYLPPDMVPVVEETIEKMPEIYDEYKKAFQGKHIPETKRNIDASKVTDHHAILPTNDNPDMNKMNDEEKKLFDMVVRRMFEAFYPPHEYESTKIITQVERFNFRTIGKTVISNGWKDVNGNATENPDKEEETVLPALRQGDKRIVSNALIKEDTTKAPPLHTDASLLLAMETAGKDSDDEEIIQTMKNHGIGTPATRAEIIERLIKVGYAERNKKNIIPTDKGIALVEIMPNEITSPETTGRWELALNKIAQGNQNADAFMASILRFVDFIVDYAKTNDKKTDLTAFEKEKEQRKKYAPAKSTVLENVKCPVCRKGFVREMPDEDGKTGSFFCTDWQKCHFRIWNNCLDRAGGPKITREILIDILDNGETTLETGDSINIDEQKLNYFKKDKDEAEISVDIEYTRKTTNGKKTKTVKKKSKSLEGVLCPICGSGSIIETDKAFSCSEWRNGCKMTIWKNCLERIEGPKMTAGVVASILKKKKFMASGTTIKLEDNKLLYYKAGKDTNGKADYVAYITKK